MTSWEEAFTRIGDLELEEDDDVLNAYPHVSVDPRGGYLIADMYEHQARRYTEDGRLIVHFGRKGKGPGEFTNPTAIARVPSGEILVADMYGLISVHDSAGTSALRATQVRAVLGKLMDIDVLNDTLLVISTGPRPGAPRLHLWDLRHDSTVASFFVPYVSERNLPAANFRSWTSAAVRGDTIAAAESQSDTIYLFNAQGEELERIPLPSRHFVTVDDVPVTYRPGAGIEALNRWTGSFNAIRKVEWLADGTFIVEYVGGSDSTFHAHVLGMTREGMLLFELEDTPRLFTTAPDGASLVFQSPSSEVPNQWTIVRPRS